MLEKRVTSAVLIRGGNQSQRGCGEWRMKFRSRARRISA
uniref:Uncharacterized protein n=1 Tax=Arundo donax TaxID=35708 RepID=A0A0A9EN30_ARUDO